MFPAVAVIFGILGGAFIAYNVSGSPGVSINPASNFLSERKRKIQGQITRLLTAPVYGDFRASLLTAKEGGANGVPASSETVKLIVAYVAGIQSGPGDGSHYYDDLGYNYLSVNGFNAIFSGNAGRWLGSDYNVLTDFTYPNIDQVSMDDGNDFGLARHHGTWLEDNFDITCLAGVVAGAAVTLASGGTLTAGGVAVAASACAYGLTDE